MKKLLVILTTVVISACSERVPFTMNNCKKLELFERCLKIIPAGPTSTVYNDWDEVILNGRAR